MNQEDILKWSKNIILKLKSKVSRDLSILVDSLSLMIEMIISLCDKQSEQIANQSKQIESQSKQIESKTKLIEKQNANIKSLTENIKELKRQLGLNSSNSSKPHSTNGFTKPKRNTSLKVKSTKTQGG